VGTRKSAEPVHLVRDPARDLLRRQPAQPGDQRLRPLFAEKLPLLVPCLREPVRADEEDVGRPEITRCSSVTPSIPSVRAPAPPSASPARGRRHEERRQVSGVDHRTSPLSEEISTLSNDAKLPGMPSWWNTRFARERPRAERDALLRKHAERCLELRHEECRLQPLPDTSASTTAARFSSMRMKSTRSPAHLVRRTRKCDRPAGEFRIGEAMSARCHFPSRLKLVARQRAVFSSSISTNRMATNAQDGEVAELLRVADVHLDAVCSNQENPRDQEQPHGRGNRSTCS